MIFDDAFIEPVAPLGSDLEWMLQSEQVSDQALAERLVLDYHARAVSLALVVLGDERLAEQAASAALKEIVQDRRKFWGKEPLQAWIYAHLVRQVQRRVTWSWRWRRRGDRARLKHLDLDNETRLRRQLLSLDPQYLLPLSLVYGHELSNDDAAASMNLPEEEFTHQLAQSRAQSFALEDVELARMLALHQQFEPEIHHEDAPAEGPGAEPPVRNSSGIERFYRRMVSQVVLGTARDGRRRSWKRVAGELILGGLGACLALIIGVNALAEEPPAAQQVTMKIVYITRTPQPGEENQDGLTVLTHAGDNHPIPSATARAFLTPFPTSTPLPRSAMLDLSPFIQEVQDSAPGSDLSVWQNSGPFNLAVLLRYLDQEADLQQLSTALRPNPQDTGIFPYEIEEYIFNTPLRASYRFGGEIDTLRSLIDFGLPVLLQHTYHGGDTAGWAAEYALVYGYDDFSEQIHLVTSSNGFTSFDYQEFLAGWLPFGYAYFVIFPAERSGDVSEALDRNFADSVNYNSSFTELGAITPDSNLEQFWILFNQGTIMTYQSDFSDAAKIYDRAFEIYQDLQEGERPMRALWYNSRPYWAYFYSGQYDKVVSLADQTLSTAGDVGLEESLYWLALAFEAQGNQEEAISTLKQAMEMNPNFAPGRYQLERLQSGG